MMSIRSSARRATQADAEPTGVQFRFRRSISPFLHPPNGTSRLRPPEQLQWEAESGTEDTATIGPPRSADANTLAAFDLRLPLPVRHSLTFTGVDAFSRTQRHGRERRDVDSRDVDRVGLSVEDQAAGQGHSSPVIWGDKLFVLSADPTMRRGMCCVQTDTGKILWQKEYASTTHPLNGRNSYASSTPAVDEQHCTWPGPRSTI